MLNEANCPTTYDCNFQVTDIKKDHYVIFSGERVQITPTEPQVKVTYFIGSFYHYTFCKQLFAAAVWSSQSKHAGDIKNRSGQSQLFYREDADFETKSLPFASLRFAAPPTTSFETTALLDLYSTLTAQTAQKDTDNMMRFNPQ